MTTGEKLALLRKKKGMTQENSQVEIASYNPNTRRKIRISGIAEVESSNQIREEMMNIYFNLRQAYFDENEMYLMIYRLVIDDISIN